MGDLGDGFRDSRQRRQAFRARFVECWQCGTKNDPSAPKCRCGEPNPNHRSPTHATEYAIQRIRAFVGELEQQEDQIEHELRTVDESRRKALCSEAEEWIERLYAVTSAIQADLDNSSHALEDDE